jgi:hypothetical protein
MDPEIETGPLPQIEMRDWVYVQRPREFDMAPCVCGNADPDWSEFAKHLWCQKCQKDFIPEHYGVLDGPVLLKACELLGIRFDRMILATGEIEVFDSDLDPADWRPARHDEYQRREPVTVDGQNLSKLTDGLHA